MKFTNGQLVSCFIVAPIIGLLCSFSREPFTPWIDPIRDSLYAIAFTAVIILVTKLLKWGWRLLSR
jgi:hypothetical protein